MLKTLTAIAALAALLAFNIAPAHAVLSGNGGGENGVQLNGGGTNGGGTNGVGDNGGGANGVGDNGNGTNGSSAGSSALTIDAFELPPQKR